MLEGKAKEMFDSWYLWTYLNPMMETCGHLTQQIELQKFHCKRLSEQWGVIQDWADSVGIKMDVGSDYGYSLFNEDWAKVNPEGCFKTRQQAREAAITKLSELVNNKY